MNPFSAGSLKKAPQSRGMSGMLRRLAARRMTQALTTGALIAVGAHSALAQGAVSGDTQYQFQNTAGNFSTGFTPGFTTDPNGQLNFGGTAAYTATDDLAAASINNLTFTNTALVTVAPSAATNVLTLTTNSAGILPSIYVGPGGATISTILGGTVGFIKNGAGVLTLQTNADTFTGTVVINAGTLAVNIGQASGAAFALANGATMTTNQNLVSGTVITALSGTATFSQTTATSFVGVFAGNGNLTVGLVGNSNPNTTFLQNFGGTFTFTNAPGLRVIQSTSGGTFNAAFATVDFANNATSFNSRNASQILLGGLASTSTTGQVGGSTNGGAVGVIIGSANRDTTYAGQIISAVAGTNAGTTTFTKVGTGTLTLTGLSVFTGATNVNGGTLALNFSTNASNLLLATSPLSFGGGTLSLVGKSSGVSSQTLGNTTLAAGGGRIVLNPNGGTGTTLTLGTLTATAAGGSLNINEQLGGTVTTTTAPGSGTGANATYGGRITFTDATGTTNFATSTTTTPFVISGLAAANYTAFPTTGGTTDTTNDLLNDGAVLASGSTTTNSLKITDDNATSVLDIGGAANTLTLTNGGLLFTGAGAYTIFDGNLASGTSAATPDLIINQFGAGNLTISAIITNGAGTGAGTLTKAGTGTLTLTGVNTYTGISYLNNGVTVITQDANLGAAATGAAVDIDTGTLQAAGGTAFALDNAGSNKRSVNIGGGGATIDVTSGTTFTISGTVTNLVANQFGPLIKTDSGTLILSDGNTNSSYGGATIISGGILSTPVLANGGTTSGIGQAANTADALILDSGTLQYTGAAQSTDRTFTLTSNGGTLDSSGTGALTFSNSNPGAYTGSGARTLTLTGTAGTAAAPNVLATQILDGTGGSTSVSKTGTGVWSLTNLNNTYTGTTSVADGTGSTLVLANNGTTNNIAGSSSINVGTAVGSGATLIVTGLNGGGITLAAGQTLSGNGTVTGGVTAGTSTTLSPGTSNVSSGVGALGVSSLNLNAGTTLNFDFASTSSYDKINDLGALTLSSTAAAGSIGFNLFQAGTLNKFTTAGTYTLINAASDSASATLADLTVLNPATGLMYAFTFGTGSGTGTSNLLLTISGTAAITSSWNVDANGNYSNPANWTNGVPTGVGADAIFGTVITQPRTVTLDANETVGEIDFNNANSYTITPSGGSAFTFNNGGTNAVLQDLNGSHTIGAPISMVLGTNVTVTNSADKLTLTGVVSNTGAAGTGTLSKAGLGTLALLGTNSYADGTTITNGTIQINSVGSLGAGPLYLNNSGGVGSPTLEALNSITTSRAITLSGASSRINVDPGATYEVDSVIADGAGGSGSLTKTGTGILLLTNAESYTGTTTISAGTLQFGTNAIPTSGSVTGPIVDNSALVFSTTSSPTYNNVISGTGTVTQAGTDNVMLGGTNSFTGNTVVSGAGGTLTLANSLALQGSTLNYNNQGGTLSFGTLTAATLGGLTGGQTLALTNTAAGNVALTVGPNNQSTTYSGALTGGGSLTKTGSGLLTLTGANTYTGSTTMNLGSLTVGAGGTIGNTTTPSGGLFITNTGGTLLVAGGSIVEGTASTIAQGTAFFDQTSGSTTFNAGLTTTSTGGDGPTIEVDGGTFTTTSLSLARNFNPATIPTTAIPNSTGFYTTGGTSSLGAFTIGNAATNSSAGSKINGGTVTATTVNIGQVATARFSVFNVNAGSFTATDTTTGIDVDATTAGGNGTFLVTGGVATTPLVTFGVTGNTTATSTLTVNGGTLYLGNAAVANNTAIVNVGGGTATVNLISGTVGASADWNTTVPAIIGTAATNGITFQAADAGGTGHNITLNGALSGSGSVTKTGSGTVTLTTTNSYSGGTTVTAGTMAATSDGALGGGNVTVVNNGTGTGGVLTLSGGATNNYIADTANLLFTTTNASNPFANLSFVGADTVNGLSFDGGNSFVATGTYGGVGSGATFINGDFAGTGTINVTATPAPEPSQFVAFGLGMFGLGGLTLRARRRAAKSAQAS